MLAHIADRALNRPLLITAEKAQVILEVLSGRIGLGAPEASRFEGDPLVRDESGGVVGLRPFNAVDGVGIITIDGTLVNRGAWIGAYSGITSYEGIRHQIKTALEDDAITGVILDINSHGGEAIGAMETAAAVRALSAAKPTVAVVNGVAASAAYALASGAREVVTTETAASGSIGVVLVHLDMSRKLDEAGITPTLIYAGSHKTDGNPFEPLPDSVRTDLQGQVDGFYSAFVRTVGAGRGARLDEAAARATQARVFFGAEAVTAGLADRIATFDDVLTELKSASRRATKQETRPMTSQTDASAEAPKSYSQAALDAAVATARSSAIEDERKRVTAILEATGAHNATTARTLIARGVDAETAADILGTVEQPSAEAGELARIKAADADAIAGTAAPTSTLAASSAPDTPDGWRQQWASSTTLQDQYVSADDYVAVKKRQAAAA